MRDVYENSFLNVAALGAADDSEGLFFDRNPKELTPAVVNLRLASTDPVQTLVAVVDLETTWWQHFIHEPLTQRGWVLQERLLSPRTLLFGRKQIYWECWEKKVCETYPDVMPSGQTSPSRAGELAEPLSVFNELNSNQKPLLWKQLLTALWVTETSPANRILSEWKALVWAYSRCDLTVSSDKLIAIAGLADRMQERLKSEHIAGYKYLAGHWEEDLLLTLCWSTTRKATAKRFTRYHAPSWSWASVNGAVIFALGHATPNNAMVTYFAQCHEAHTETLNGRLFGEVLSGYVKLSTRLALFEISSQKKLRFGKTTYGGYTLAAPHQSASPGELFRDAAEMGLDVYSHIRFDFEDAVRDEVSCALLLLRPGKESSVMVDGILLENIPEGSKLTFRKIGAVNITVMRLDEQQSPASVDLRNSAVGFFQQYALVNITIL